MLSFSGCSDLTSITIPNSVTSIGDYTFEGCDKLTIYGNEGSYAQIYANKNDIPFKLIEEYEDPTTDEPTTDEPNNKDNKIKLKNTNAFKPVKTDDMPQGILVNNALTAKGIKALSENKDLTIKDKDGKEIKDGELVGSGAIINLIKDSKVIDKYTIVVLGDTNGDAKVTAADARLALRMSARLENPTAWQFEAAARVSDINAKPEKITAAMARKILRVSAKLEEF